MTTRDRCGRREQPARRPAAAWFRIAAGLALCGWLAAAGPLRGDDAGAAAAAQRGRNALRNSRSADARAAFEQALALTERPTSRFEALLGIGAACERDQDYAAARGAYARAAELLPRCPPTYRAMATQRVALSYQAEGQYAQAIEAFRRVAADPNAAADLRAEAWLHIGHGYKTLGQYAEALDAYQEARQDKDCSAYLRSRALLEIADTRARMGDPKAAIALYEQVLPLRGIPLRHRSLARHEIRRLQDGTNAPAAIRPPWAPGPAGGCEPETSSAP